MRQIADADVLLALKLTQSEAQPVSEELRAYLLGRQAQQNPAKVSDILVQLNLLKEPACKLYAAFEMGMAVAKTDPGLAEQLYQIARPLTARLGVHNETIEWLAMTNDGLVAHSIALAGVLHKTADVDAILTYLNALSAPANGTFDPTLQSVFEAVFEAAARVSPAFLSTAYQRIHDDRKRIAVERAAATLAQSDPAAARQVITLSGAYHIDSTPESTEGPTPPDDHTGRLLRAAAYQPKAEAEATIMEVFGKVENRTPANLAQVNAIDAELAKTLYARYKTDFQASAYQVNPDNDAGISDARANNADLLSSIDPVEARLLLETEYTITLLKARQGDNSEDPRHLPQAMFAFDLQRAEQMAETIAAHDPYLQSFFCWQGMHYLLMTRAQRAIWQPS